MPYGQNIRGYPLSFMGQGQGVDGEQDALAELLASLEQAQAPAMPRTSGFQSALGGIGDSLIAVSRVLSGGQAPDYGPYAAERAGQRQAFEQQSAEAEAANRDLRNRIRIGQFQGRQEAEAERAKDRRIRVAKVQDDALEASREKDKQRLRVEGDIRAGLVEEIVKRGVKTEGMDLLTTPTTQLKEMLDAADPSASFQSIMKSIPADMEMGKVHIDKDGKLSYDLQRTDSKNKNDEIPAGIITALISAGEDPSPFISDPTLAGAARAAAGANSKKILDTQADTFLEDMERVSGQNAIGPDGETVDAVNVGTQSAAGDIRRMGKSGAGPEEIDAYYAGEVDAANQAVAEGAFSEQQAIDYVTRVRQMLKVRFPDHELAEPEPPAEEPEPAPAPAAAPQPPGPPGAMDKVIGGIGKGLGNAAGGFRRALGGGAARR